MPVVAQLERCCSKKPIAMKMRASHFDASSAYAFLTLAVSQRNRVAQRLREIKSRALAPPEHALVMPDEGRGRARLARHGHRARE